MSSSKNESHPDTLPPVRCSPPAGRHAVSQDEFIYPLAALNAAQRRHLFFNGQAELFISCQEPSAPGTGLYAKKHAVRSTIARLLSVKALQSSPCRSRFVGLHDSFHPFGGVPTCMPVSVTELETFMTSQTPQLFDNLPLVAMSCWRLVPLPLLPTCHFDHTVEIAYEELGRSLARNVQRETGESGGKSARSETGESQLRTQNPVCRALPHAGP